MHHPLQGQNGGALFWIQEEEHFKNEDNDEEDQNDDDDSDDDHSRNHELCGIFYYPYDSSLKKYESYKPGCKIHEYNICQDKFGFSDKFILIDQGFDFHILETKDRKIIALRKSQTIQEMINMPMIDFYRQKLRYNRDFSNCKNISIFSHDHLIVADNEGLQYLDLQN